MLLPPSAEFQREVFFGQHLDLVAHRNVERMYDLKTGSYTVRGPLRLGAILAGARASELEALDRIAAPLGVAFQLRDELLGAFGDPSATGKPAGNDVRAGKFTVLIREAKQRLPEPEQARLDRAWGKVDAPDGAVAEAVELLVSCGAKAHVEEKLTSLVDETQQAVKQAPFHSEKLTGIISLLVDRDR